MGYTTWFEGEFKVTPPLSVEVEELMEGLNQTRRMKRDVKILGEMNGISEEEAIEKWGTNGEFYFDVEDFSNCGQTEDKSIIDYNYPPGEQPSLWCNWTYNKEKECIQWDEGEKFYEYVPWIKYLMKKILKPKGYKLNGKVEWQGEDPEDTGSIKISNNMILYTKPMEM